MWYGRQASPTSSTSTVDQQEIVFDETQQQRVLLYTQQQQQQQSSTAYSPHANANANANQTNPAAISLNQVVGQNFIVNNVGVANSRSPSAATNNKTTAGRGRQPGPGRGTKRPRNSQYSRMNGTKQNNNTNATSAATTNAAGTTSKANANSNASAGNNNSSATTPGGNTKCSPPKKPKLYNLGQQVTPWKALQHHFLKYTDVKSRPEKRMTMAELGNEVLQRRNGWKVHHLVGQLTDLIQNETRNREKISSLLELFVVEGAKRVHELTNNCHKLPEQYAAILQSQRSYGKNEFHPDLIVAKLDDLIRGDIQRSNMFDDQLRDCRDLIVRITNEHRDRVSRITTKFNKRIQL